MFHVTADGDLGITLLVFKGSTSLYHAVLKTKFQATKTFASFLTRRKLFSSRSEGGGVDGSSSYE